jgi:hypothetical protein
VPEQDVRGKSLLDLLWEHLDHFVDDLQLVDDVADDSTTLWEARGRAHAAAVCVALATNPYHPNVAAVKAEALERWEQRYDVPPPAEPHGTPISERGLARRARRQARRAARNG